MAEHTFNLSEIPQRQLSQLNLLQAIAIHEAGHAAVAACLGMVVEAVEIWYKPGATPESKVAQGHMRGIDVGLSSPSDQIAVFVAGSAAVSLKEPAITVDDLERYEPGDYWLVGQAMNQIVPAPKPKRRRLIVRHEWNRSRKILEDNWRGVISLGNALIDEGKAVENRKGNTLEVRAELTGPRLSQLLAFTRT